VGDLHCTYFIHIYIDKRDTRIRILQYYTRGRGIIVIIDGDLYKFNPKQTYTLSRALRLGL